MKAEDTSIIAQAFVAVSCQSKHHYQQKNQEEKKQFLHTGVNASYLVRL